MTGFFSNLKSQIDALRHHLAFAKKQGNGRGGIKNQKLDS
jgi:hypothetical protein